MAILRMDDLKGSSESGLDMWGALVEEARVKGLLLEDIKSWDVEELVIEIKEAR